jgi:hypothetical protein
LLAAVWASACAGCAALALSLDRHWRQVTAQPLAPPASAVRLRCAGAAGLCIALMLACWRDGAAFGVLLWTLSLPACALGVALTLAWRPAALAPLARLFRSTGTCEGRTCG